MNMMIVAGMLVILQSGAGSLMAQGRLNLPGGLNVTNRGQPMELVFIGMLVLYALIAAVTLYLAWILVHAVVDYLQVKTRKRNMEAKLLERDVKGQSDRISTLNN
jgi:hypothetical protein